MLIFSNIFRIHDGSGAERRAIHTNVDLHVEGPTIREIRPHDPNLRVGDGHRLVDCGGLTATPGIVDCHGHVTVLGLSRDDMEVMNGDAWLVYVEKILHTTLVDGGVTTMRDIGGATHLIKRMVDDGNLIGPRLKIAIGMLSTTGGHADFRGPDRCHTDISKLWPARRGRPSSIVDGPWECRKRVRELAGCGADLIKICTSPGVASPTDRLEHRDFTAAEVAAICEEAEGRGLRVAAHAHSAAGIELAILHGVRDLQHISFMDRRLVEMAYERGCTVTPTSWVTAELQTVDHLEPFVVEKVKRVAEVHQAAVAYASAGGLQILAGTDPVLRGMHGRNYMEIVHLVRDGLSPLAAWYSATGLAAGAIGQPDTGVLAAGKRADLLLWNDDVIERPERMAAGTLLEVVKDGVAYRGGLRDLPQRTYRSVVHDELRRGFET